MKLEAVKDLKVKARQLLTDRFDGSSKLARQISLGVGMTQNPEEFILAVRIRSRYGGPSLTAQVKNWFVKRVTTASNLDVMYTGPVYISPPKSVASTIKDPVLKIGSSISHYTIRGGTLGFFAKSTIDGSVGLVSANHVIAVLDKGEPESAIIHPAKIDRGRSGDRVAGLARFVPLSGAGEKFVDCAFAQLDQGQKYNASDLGNGRELKTTPADPKASYNVFKIGRKTKETSGRVRSFNFDCFEVFNYGYELNDVPFEDQIEVESETVRSRFSDDGDSGALVFNDDDQAVGLLFAETQIGGTHGNGLAYVNPIASVLAELEITIHAPRGDQQQP